MIEHKTFYDMKFNEILGLNKSYKMQVVQILIESMISDKEADIIAFYETELCECELFNKYKEAIRDIKLSIQPVCGGASLETAIEALEKQIPKQVQSMEVRDEEYFDGYCPNCEKYLVSKSTHCSGCGQKLNWEVEEDEF